MESAANGVGTSTGVEAPVRKARADCEGLKRHPRYPHSLASTTNTRKIISEFIEILMKTMKLSAKTKWPEEMKM